MVGPLENRTVGQPLEFYASEQNDYTAAALAHKARQFSQGRDPSLVAPDQGVVFIRNDSGEDVDMYHYLVLTGFIFTPMENEDGFKEQASFSATRFNFNDIDHFNAQIVILQEPIKAGKIGKAMIKGCTQVRVDVVDENHTCYRREHNSTILKSSMGGDIEGIAKEETTGETWAYGALTGRPEFCQFQVQSLDENDIVLCKPYVDDEAWPVDVKVAMPYLLRRTPFDDTDGPKPARQDIKYTYSKFDERQARTEDDEGEEDETEDQIIIPSYTGLQETYTGDIIYARRNVFGGVGVKGEGDIPVEWVDVNTQASFWMNNPDAEGEEE